MSLEYVIVPSFHVGLSAAPLTVKSKLDNLFVLMLFGNGPNEMFKINFPLIASLNASLARDLETGEKLCGQLY